MSQHHATNGRSSSGFNDTKGLKANSDFGLLRVRDDFKKIVSELKSERDADQVHSN